MARKLRIEAAGGCYHVLNRGNYRADIFGEAGAKQAFLKCLTEACAKTGWRVHAWCLMSNHYHLALETPRPNLVEGMQWFQATFATRFNRFRQERGHVFQGRYKALPVEPGGPLGALCHYIHLNPVRASISTLDALADWPWCSFRELIQPRHRAPWFDPVGALAGAGELADSPAGRRSYQDYLHWLSAQAIEQKRLGFDRMSKGWALGSKGFKTDLLADEKTRLATESLGDGETREARELLWAAELERLKAHFTKKTREDATKSADWKVAIAAKMKEQTTASNPWLAEQLAMGSPFCVSRLATECRTGRRAAAALSRLIAKSKA
jgi:REP element-mobilizing transposase RayT